MDNTPKWEDYEREDLRMIPTMIAAGWKPIFHSQDITTKSTTPEYPPQHGVHFSKGVKYVWPIIDRNTHSRAWQTADLIHGYYENHRAVETLNIVLNEGKDRQSTCTGNSGLQNNSVL